jgi:Protein of unknown function (DUF2934)
MASRRDPSRPKVQPVNSEAATEASPTGVPSQSRPTATPKRATPTRTESSATSQKTAHRVEISNESRYRMICEAAYLRAERRGFAPGQEVDDWLAAEQEVERLLAVEHVTTPQ